MRRLRLGLPAAFALLLLRLPCLAQGAEIVPAVDLCEDGPSAA
jgi:hypothetical protein